jgi:iron complex outermembrane receptor protein
MKAGSYSPSSDALQFTDSLEFNKEVLHAYETGFKTTAWGGKLRVNAAAFYYDYRDYQAFVFSGISNIVTNLDAKVYGGELEAIMQPADGWDILLGLALLDATVEDVPGAIGATGTTGDQDMLLAPDITVNWMGRKEWFLAGGASVSMQLDGVYVSDQWSNTVNSVGAEIEEYSVWNTKLTYNHNDQLQGSVFVNNLLDEDYYGYAFDVSAFFATSVSYRAYNPPRWVGASVRYQF